MSSFSESVLQDKLARLSSSQDSIETLSSWIIHHRTHASTSVTKWLENVICGDADKQILLLYLANDVLQNSRRKSLAIFHELFKEPLKHAASLASLQKNREVYLKLVALWRERRIYDAIYLNELQHCIEPLAKATSEPEPSAAVPVGDFKLPILEDSLTELQKFEGEMKVKEHGLTRLTIDVSSMSSLSRLKDKSSGGKFESDFEDASKKLQEYHECLGIEVEERNNLLAMLTQCKTYHCVKTNELQNLLKDYGNIQKHLEAVQVKLKEKVGNLEKAKHTATSDPTSKQDITVAGDMEIDSDDGEDEETAQQKPHPLPMPPQGIVPAPQLPHPLPHAPSIPRPPFPVLRPNISPYPLTPPINPAIPPMTPPFLPPTGPIPYSPSMPKVFTPPHIPATSPAHAMPPRPFFPPINKEPQIPMSRPPFSVENNYPAARPPPTMEVDNDYPFGGNRAPQLVDNNDNLNRFPRENDYTAGNEDGPAPQSLAPKSSFINDRPLQPPIPVPSNSHPATSVSTLPTQNISPVKSQSPEKTTPISSDTSKTSIDDRLKDLATRKSTTGTLPLSLFQDYSDSDSDEEKPYSPSSAPPTNMATFEEDKESVPTLNMTPPTPEYVTFSTDKSLLASTNTVTSNTRSTSEERVTAMSPAQAPPLNYYQPIASIETNQTSIVSTTGVSSSSSNAASISQAVVNLTTSIGSMTKPLPVRPENIKITPSLTNLLDKIFPQLSQSLQSERKRKQDGGESGSIEDESDSKTKIPRTETNAKPDNVVFHKSEHEAVMPVTSSIAGLVHPNSKPYDALTTPTNASYQSSSIDANLVKYEEEINNISKLAPPPPPSQPNSFNNTYLPEHEHPNFPRPSNSYPPHAGSFQPPHQIRGPRIFPPSHGSGIRPHHPQRPGDNMHYGGGRPPGYYNPAPRPRYY